jgi:hypothetical protein
MRVTAAPSAMSAAVFRRSLRSWPPCAPDAPAAVRRTWHAAVAEDRYPAVRSASST